MSNRPMQRLFRYLRTYNASLSFAIGSSVINKVFDLMPPFLTAWIIDTVSGKRPAWLENWLGFSDLWESLVFLAILTVVIFAFESFFEWLFKKAFLRLAQRVQHDLRLIAYQKMQTRELAYFEEQRTGNLMSMLNNDINQLERFLNTNLNEIVQLTVLLIVAGWSLFSVAPLLGLIGMAPIPFIILGSLYYQRKVAPLYQQVRESVGSLNNRLENNISGIPVIKSFATERYELDRVRQASLEYRDVNFKAIKWSAAYFPLIRMFIALGFAASLLIGAYWVLNDMNGFTVGGLAFFAMMIQRLLWPVTRLGMVFDEFERARASARRIFTLIDSENQIKEPEQPLPLPLEVGNIDFKNVSFSYQEELPILKGIDLSIRKGETIGIAGATGGGKSTLIKLLLRFYDPTDGCVEMEGIDLKQLDLHDLRSKIALVSQEVYLFHGSIRENIAYGNPEESMENITQAAKLAQLHDFITTLPDGYESIVGERGIKLSGGQRQRLSLARAILKDTPILILDEATSAVDTETERAIQESLQTITKTKTALIIAHRLSTIRHADRIIVLKDGAIVEQGKHDELLDLDGIYAELWTVQTGSRVAELV